jgi:serine O-acetyltransferase
MSKLIKNKEYDQDLRSFAQILVRKGASCASNLPVKKEAQQFVDELLCLLFPHFSEKECFSLKEVQANLLLAQTKLENLLKEWNLKMVPTPKTISQRFFAELPNIHAMLWKDAEAINRGDPAAESLEEVVLAYPGFLAISMYRIAHEFYRMKVPIFPRLISEYGHQLTGIDIHPGAQIGSPFFIDHGTGIVIGETTRIGRNVKIYQGVTLGALSVQKKLARMKRHPTIEDSVVIYAQAVILGGETVVGHDSVIGGNVFLTHSVSPYSTVYSESKVTVEKIFK